ncbi:MAG: hypothetical protein ACYCQJ_03585 [Nitrososphaerales archaeon]
MKSMRVPAVANSVRELDRGWQTVCHTIASSGNVRPYWSERDLVSHLMSEMELVDGTIGLDAPVVEVDWHIDFTLRPNLFSGNLRRAIEDFGAIYGPRIRPDLILNKHNDEQKILS